MLVQLPFIFKKPTPLGCSIYFPQDSWKNKCKNTPLSPKALRVTAAPWISPPAPWIYLKTAQQMDSGKASEHKLLCSSSQNYLHDNTDMKDTEIAFLLKQIFQVKTKDYVLTLTTTQCTLLCHSQTHPVPQYCCHLWHLKSQNPLSN